MRSTLPLARRASSGFSLLEVIVAIAILGVGVVSLIQLFGGTLRSAKRSGDYSRGLVFARSLMEEAYAMDDETKIGGYFDLDGVFEGERSIALIAEEEGARLYEITVKVSWPPSGSTELTATKAFYAAKQ